MFDIGLGEVAVLIVAALFVFGPDRLPQVVAQAARTLRQVRTLAAGARAEINDAIGPELRELNVLGDLGELNPMADLGEIRNLSPKKLLNNAMFGVDDTPLRPVPAADGTGAVAGAVPAATLGSGGSGGSGGTEGTEGTEGTVAKSTPPAPAFDADAT